VEGNDAWSKRRPKSYDRPCNSPTTADAMNLEERVSDYLARHDVAEEYGRRVSHYYVKYLDFLGMKDTMFVDHTEHHLVDSHGTRYLDLVAGYGSCHFGRSPVVHDVIRQSVDLKIPNLVEFNVPVLASMLAEEILEYVGSPFERLFFTNGGAESVDYALKMARLVTGKVHVLCFSGCYHGLTLGAISVNGMHKHQKLFNTGCDQNILPFNDCAALEEAVSRRNKELAGVIVEPIQGRTGEVASEEFLACARELCDRYNLVLIFDEIKTGFGRTGRKFFFDWHSIHPDIFTIAKGISAGVGPIGAVIYRNTQYAKIFNSIERIAVFSSTFKESNIAMAAGLAVMELYRANPRIHDTVLAREQQIREKLENRDSSRYALEVKGRGLLLTIALKQVRGKRVMHSLIDLIEGDMFYDKVCKRLFVDKQILISIPNRFGASLAMIPALNIDEADMNYFCDSLLEVLDDMLSQPNLSLFKEVISDARTVL
jgi:ornithine--oxo-acid transaminase